MPWFTSSVFQAGVDESHIMSANSEVFHEIGTLLRISSSYVRMLGFKSQLSLQCSVLLMCVLGGSRTWFPAFHEGDPSSQAGPTLSLSLSLLLSPLSAFPTNKYF